jgi:YesN/AraC family two-component response regulator
MSISVLIADDQSLVRAGFRMILETDQGLRVVAEASDGAQAVGVHVEGVVVGIGSQHWMVRLNFWVAV